jgi:hypothetical protein
MFSGGVLRIRRKTEVRIERREIAILRTSSGNPRCGVCEHASLMLNAAETAEAFGIPFAAVQQWLQQGHIHGCTTPEGELLVCMRSLRKMV